MKSVTTWIIGSLALVGFWTYMTALRAWCTGEPASYPADQLWIAPLTIGIAICLEAWLLRRKEGR